MRPRKRRLRSPEGIAATGNPLDPPAVVVSGGETTVTVDGDGVGGPNQEFALSAAVELAGSDDAAPETVVAAVDTDGVDGPTDAAGAIVDGETVAVREGRHALADNDATTVLGAADAVITTSPTGTNVNDLRVVVVPEP
ncbi:MAG: putative glycerate kinase [Halonotius sp. J07HN4]|nr:MAG: putative glycerate kinase [Halonotius sp. J07HN4]